MTTPTAPDVIAALRTVWRASREHKREQLIRLGRIFVLVLVPQLVATGVDQLTQAVLIALAAAAAETAFRQVFPALGAAGADSAPGVAIVPEQLA